MFHLGRKSDLACYDIGYNPYDLLVQLLSLTSFRTTPSFRAKEKVTSQRKALLSSSMSTEVDVVSQVRGGLEVVFPPFVVSLEEEVLVSTPFPGIWLSGHFIKQSQDNSC